MAIILRTLLVVVVACGLSGLAQANPTPRKRSVLKAPSETEAEESPAEVGEEELSQEAKAFYSGVTLSGGDPPTTVAPPPGFQNLTWTGFRIGEQTAEVFLQLTSQVSYKEKIKGRRVFITLDKVKVPLKNNLRQVIAEHFPSSPVTRFKVSRIKRNKIRLEIKLRKKLAPSISMRTFGQYSFLIVSFPVEAKESK